MVFAIVRATSGRPSQAPVDHPFHPSCLRVRHQLQLQSRLLEQLRNDSEQMQTPPCWLIWAVGIIGNTKKKLRFGLFSNMQLTIQLIGQLPCNRIYGTGVEFSMTCKEEVPTLRLHMHSLGPCQLPWSMSESSRKLCDASANHYRHQGHQPPNRLLTPRRLDSAESDAVQEHEARWKDHASRTLELLQFGARQTPRAGTRRDKCLRLLRYPYPQIRITRQYSQYRRLPGPAEAPLQIGISHTEQRYSRLTT